MRDVPCRSFHRAYGREIEFYKDRAERKLIGYDDRARAALAKLGLTSLRQKSPWSLFEMQSKEPAKRAVPVRSTT